LKRSLFFVFSIHLYLYSVRKIDFIFSIFFSRTGFPIYFHPWIPLHFIHGYNTVNRYAVYFSGVYSKYNQNTNNRIPT